jgi:CHAT domain-containing protein
MNAKSSLPDFFDQFKNIVFIADTKNSLEERKEYLAANGDSFRQELVALKTSENWIDLGVMLKVIEQFDINSSVSFFETAPYPKLCKNLDKHKKLIDENLAEITLARSKKLFEKAKTGESTKKYLDRHRYVETAIRLVWELFPADSTTVWPYTNIKKSDLYKFITKCYLLRSKLALPKGSDIPKKKIEAAQKAWEWINKADSSTDDLMIEIALEKERWEKNISKEWIKEILNSFFKNTDFYSSNPIHRSAYDKACQIGINLKNFDNKILELPSVNNDPFFLLHQAKAANRKSANDQGNRLKKAVSALSGIPLSYHLWDDTVDFIKKAKADKIDGWDEAAINAWEICMHEEAKLKLGIQVRWYWSRQADLYELAFMAAVEKNDPVLAANSADSLKSRPSVKLVQAENSLYKKDKKVLEKFREIETNFATGNFHTGLENAKTKKGSAGSWNLPDIQNVPTGWTAVHFYISLNDIGYAVMIDAEGKKTINKIQIEETWNAYKDWKVDLKKAGNKPEDTSHSLAEMCKACGRMLAPVLENIKTDSIIFIPYGFLHLVPIHAALINDNNPLFQTKKCLFLPAWSLKPDTSSQNRDDQGILLTNWTSKTDLENFIDHYKWTNTTKTKCTPDNYFSMFNVQGYKPPGFLAFYCHGQGNFINPFRSALKLNSGYLTHQDIVQKTDIKALLGTKIILTACESDFVSGTNDITDEHLSIASAFLQKGASEVCGTLFECYPDIAGEIIVESLNNSNPVLYETVHEV